MFNLSNEWRLERPITNGYRSAFRSLVQCIKQKTYYKLKSKSQLNSKRSCKIENDIQTKEEKTEEEKYDEIMIKIKTERKNHV